MKTIAKRVIAGLALAGFASLVFADHFTFGALSNPILYPQANTPMVEAIVKKLNELTPVTGDKFSIVRFNTPQELGKALATGKVDLAFTKVETYFYAKQISNNVNILGITYYPNKNNLTYASDFITLKSNHNINSWQDLKGKRVLLKNKYSLSGSVYPMTFLADQGVNYTQFFKSISFVTLHADIITELLAGKADAGVVWNDVYENSADKDKLKVIYQIKNIPNPMMAGSSKLTGRQIKSLKADLTAIPSDILKPYYIAGFETTIPAGFYDIALKKIEQFRTISPKLVETYSK